MRIEWLRGIVAGVCIGALLIPSTPGGTSGRTAGGRQATASQTTSGQGAPAGNGKAAVCAVTAKTAPPLSAPMSAALKLYRTGKFAEAIAAYQAILPAGGGEAAAAYAGLTRVYLKQKNVAAAADAAQKAVALTPDHAPAIVAQAEVYFRQGKIPDAEAAFLKPLLACNLDARAFLGLNRIHQVSLNYKHAKSEMARRTYSIRPIRIYGGNIWIRCAARHSSRRSRRIFLEILATTPNC